MFRKILGLVLAVFFVATIGACVIDGSDSGSYAKVESQSDHEVDLDATREGALGLIFGMAQIDDRLDVGANDREDWRYILVAESGVMSIIINIDTPTTIDGGWNIIDSEGRTLHRQSFSKTQGYYDFKDFPVKKGIYFFQIFATEGKSIYTIATSFRPNMPEPFIVEDLSEPEEDTPTRTRPKKTREPSTSTTPTTPVKETPPKVEGKRVVGFVSLVTPQNDGSAEITIRNAGKDKGIEAGSIGQIEGTSMKIETTQCFATSCRAIIPNFASTKDLKKGANVVFTSK